MHNLEFYNNYIVLTIQTIKINIQLKIFILLKPNLPLTHITAIKYKNTYLKHNKTIENVGFSFCLLIIMKLNYVPDLYKQN